MNSIQKAQTNGIIPTTMDEMIRFADMLAKSSFVPKQYVGKPGDIIAAVTMGLEVGLKPMQSLRCIAVINGRPSLWGDAMLALAMSHPDFEYIKEDVTDNGATCTVKRKSMVDPVTRSFSYEDAKKAHLIGKAGPWTDYTKRMYQMRARAFALRDTFPDVLMGLYTVEEASDIVEVDAGVEKLKALKEKSKQDLVLPKETFVVVEDVTQPEDAVIEATATGSEEPCIEEKKEEPLPFSGPCDPGLLSEVYEKIHTLEELGYALSEKEKSRVEAIATGRQAINASTYFGRKIEDLKDNSDDDV